MADDRRDVDENSSANGQVSRPCPRHPRVPGQGGAGLVRRHRKGSWTSSFLGSSATQTILSRGFIELDPSTRMFRLGFRLWEVAQSYAMTDDVVSLAQPLMDELTAVTTETVQLAGLEGLDNVYLAISESPHPMKLVSSVGKRLPAQPPG